MKFQPKGPKRFEHQKAGLRKAIDTGGVFALLFDPGLGKTATVLDYASILALKSVTGEARVLVVAPLAAVDTWVMQAETYVSDQVNFWAEALGGTILQRAEALASRGGNPRRNTPTRGPRKTWQGPRAAHYHRSLMHNARTSGMGLWDPSEGPDAVGNDKPRLIIEVVNFDAFASRSRYKSGTMADVMVDAVRRYNPDLVVVDESHKIKSAGAHTSRALVRVGEHVKRRAILTGTVMPHSPLDVFGQWNFLQPYAFGTRLADGSTKRATFGSFKDRYAELGGWMGREVIGFKNLDEMQDIMAQNAIVARKKDALDLPALTTITVPVHLSQKEKDAYKAMADDLAINLPTGNVTVNNRLTQMMRLRQLTSGYMPDDQGSVVEIGDSKINVIKSIAHDTLSGKKRLVVFSMFTHEIALLSKALAEKGTEIMTITGETDPSERIKMRLRFGSEAPERIILIAQIKTMSLAVNELVTASDMIFGSLSQQRDDLIQGMDRINRLGQTNKMTVYFALAPGTVDEVIMKSHNDRTSLETAMLAHIQDVHANGVRSRSEIARDNRALGRGAVNDALSFFMAG